MKPKCAVRGELASGAMCASVLVGAERCGYSGECEHQRVEIETATRWCVRWHTPDGMYTFADVSRDGQPITRPEVEAWAASQVLLHPKKYASVALCYVAP